MLMITTQMTSQSLLTTVQGATWLESSQACGFRSQKKNGTVHRDSGAEEIPRWPALNSKPITVDKKVMQGQRVLTRVTTESPEHPELAIKIQS